MALSLEKPRGQMVMEINVVCLSTKRHRQDNPLQHWFPCKLKLISEADNNWVMNRLVLCQCRQQSYSKLPDQVLTFWLGYQPDHCCLWLLSLSWDLNLPFPLHRWKWTKLHQGECAQMAKIAGHPQAQSCKNNQQSVYESSFTSHSGMTREQLNRTIYTQAGMVHWPNKTQSILVKRKCYQTQAPNKLGIWPVLRVYFAIPHINYTLTVAKMRIEVEL